MDQPASDEQTVCSEVPVARTAGVIARELGATLTQVTYVLNTRHHIRPIGRAGKFRLYNEEAVRLILHELNTIAARRPRSDI